ncbi:rod-binding protein [Acetohalobium arabaticum]|uniref:Flagellar protein FlgJ n=1 Tax=Acetohalobium arabaticum (strain ATCC 49924 / DSM 5501 / Z-7288) TaxID=574087 RepID=D9QTW9_ACEAZ|nr:rod-binding protein [Acetohalobium arabaticum]ADL13690.1 Flagellar protein FlgJ [Acetohalobium arabaticum DSM 5501]
MKINSTQRMEMLTERSRLKQNQRKQSEFKEKLSKLQQQSSKDEQENKELKKATQKFSSVFVGLMLKEMRKTIPESGYLDGGLKEDIFKDMLDRKYAEEIADSKQLHLTDKLYQQLSQKTE